MTTTESIAFLGTLERYLEKLFEEVGQLRQENAELKAKLTVDEKAL